MSKIKELQEQLEYSGVIIPKSDFMQKELEHKLFPNLHDPKRTVWVRLKSRYEPNVDWDWQHKEESHFLEVKSGKEISDWLNKKNKTPDYIYEILDIKTLW